MAFKYYLDGQLTDTPISDKELSTTIKRDRALGILTITQDADIVYNGNNGLNPLEISGYDYLLNLFENQICQEVTITIMDEIDDLTTLHIYTGVIKVPSIKVDYQKVILTTKVQDKGFYSYINNNKSVKVDLSEVYTKSNEPLDAITWYSVDLYRQDFCVYGSNNNYFYKGFLIRDVFEFVIKYISDNVLSFQSDFFDNLPQKPFLFSGQALANSYTFYPSAQEPVITLSFGELFNELSKIYNLVLWIDSSDPSNPIVRIEDSKTSFQNDLVYSFNDIKEMVGSIDTNSLYAIVDSGSENYIDPATPINQTIYPMARDYFAWKKETYYPLGQCNIDTTLDLVNKYVIEPNAIHQSINANSTDYFGDLFIIECSNIDDYNKTAEGHQFNFYGDNSCFYNWNLNNYNKLQRYSDDFESPFGTGFQNVTDGFRASLSNQLILEANPLLPLGGIYLQPTYPNATAPLTIEPLVFGDVSSGINYNNGGNYNPTNGVYSIPSNGLYSFTSSIDFSMSGTFVPAFTNYFFITLVIRHYDSLNNLLFQSGKTFTYGAVPPNNVIQIENVSGVVNAIAGDYVQVLLEVAYVSNLVNFNDEGIKFNVSSYFECNGTPNGGLTPTTGSRQPKKYFYEFDYEIPQSDWLTLLQNTTKMISFEKDGVTRYGWIETIKHNDWSGLATIKLITNNASNT